MILLAASLPARADMRCAPHVITTGLTLFEVFERCGLPVFEYHRVDEVVPGVWVDVYEMIYEQGGNRFRRLLRFENGRLTEIELLDKPRTLTPGGVTPGGG